MPVNVGAGPEPLARHAALLDRIARRVSIWDGAPPGGARLGPRLLLMGAIGLDDDRLAHIGAAVELLRRATLTHREPEREGPLAGRDGGTFSAILHGDRMMAESFRLLSRDGGPEAVAILAGAMGRVAEGELLRHARGPGDPDAVLRGAAYHEGVARVAAWLAGWNEENARRYADWARQAGVFHLSARDGIDGAAAPDARGLPVDDTLMAAFMAALGQPDEGFP